MVNKPAPEQSPDSHERHRLYQENKNLRSQLKALLESASDYRSSQRRFETFELKLLNCQYFYELIDCLIVDITHDFKLDAVSLTLFDPEHIAQEMLKKNPIDSDNLRFEDNYSELLRPLRELQSKNILPGGDLSRMRPQLSRNTGFIELARFPQTAIRSMALLPLLRQQTLVGYLCLGSYNRDRFNPDLATELVNHLAAIIAVCIENILSKEQLHQLSQIDMLTRVKNRRAFERDMHREISRSKRETTPLSCLFVDLDHFKKINDTYGHGTGDRVLKVVASAIQELLRETDTLARIGGEEFTILLSNTEQERALRVAERIRAKVEGLEIPDDQGYVVTLTTSIGYTTWQPEQYDSLLEKQIHKALLHCADKAVYKAKMSGRNRVRGEAFQLD